MNVISIVSSALTAVATAILVWATVSFQRWIRAQRNPRPIFVTGNIRVSDDKASWVIELLFTNIGDVPIFFLEPPVVDPITLGYAVEFVEHTYKKIGEEREGKVR